MKGCYPPLLEGARPIGSGAKLIITEKSSHGGINFEEPELVVRTIVCRSQ
jgi:hypothetical protein